MSIYGNAVKKPITTIMIFIAVVLFGLYSVVRLPVDLYPEIEFPAITVMTTYPGASAHDIETNITKPIEDALNTVDDLKEVTSVSRDNISVVTLEFEYETDLNEAANNIRDGLSMVSDQLPEEAEDPNIFKFNSSMMPIQMFAITADESYEGIEKLLDEKLINPLNRVDGIASISIIGAPTREVAVEINPRRLEAYNLTIEQIGGILAAENLNMPTGNIEMGKLDYPLRVEGEFESSDELNNIVLANFNGQAIYLKDVATIRDSIKEMTMDEKINGENGVRFMVMKQSGANTVSVARDLNNRMDELRNNLPNDIKIQTVFDSSEFIKGSINNLSQTLMFALIFVMLVVLFFLGRWRATFIVVLTIPISLIVSFIYLRLTGNSINIISLSALSIAIGMVVDDAIVVLENITKHIERGSSPREAAIYATNEVWLAVIVTTLTVVAVFFPMTMISGMTGIMFRQLGWIVTITVTTSTLAAITLTPMLSSKMLRLRNKKKKPGRISYERTIEPMLNNLDNWYGRILHWSLFHKRIIVVSALGLFIASILMASNLGAEFMPQTDESRFSISVELQSGTRVDQTITIARKVDSILHNQFSEVDLIATSAGADDEGGFISMFQSTGSNIINFNVGLVDLEDREQSVWDIAEQVRKNLSDIPEIITFNVSTSNSGLMAGNTVDVEIYGYDIEQTTAIARQIGDSIELIDGAREIEISREDEKPELLLELNRDKLAANGLNTATVSQALYNRVEGLTATRFRELGEEYDVVVRFKKEFRNSITDIKNIAVTNTNGQSVRIGELGEVKEYYAPPNIEHKRRERIVTVSATPYKTSLGELATEIQNKVEKIDLPREVMIEVGGAYEDQQEGFMDLALLLMLSLLLVYIVMASQFESLKMPFIIMFSIPFAFSGVIFALLLTNTTLSVIAGLGAVMLVGIVVKNAIVLVDYINLMRDRGHELNEAITMSGKSRLRPVLMTAMTTILGMLPLALSTGEGSEIWSPMGISVIGGLVASTIITMVIVPVVYKLFATKGERNKKQKVRAKFAFLQQKN
ncbi:Multidrug transporter MdtC [Salinivirga cyanobacteriivorans]|uniref:Multidrug transporter MdtC n=1 Tax=Salinivirga cyanobacteriivorans TaxID=1307839 RepID=A0A0S2I0M1_9BACT|nr:efflux RND transporter permease subunit [Salinivirga cyanobacteriivorans]ALO15838.1 Multidrug transporter MdtC [Salinivirga cyanobacteriivorans]